MGKRAERRARTEARLNEIKQQFYTIIQKGIENGLEWDAVVDQVEAKMAALLQTTPVQEHHLLLRVAGELSAGDVAKELDRIEAERLAKGGQA